MIYGGKKLQPFLRIFIPMDSPRILKKAIPVNRADIRLRAPANECPYSNSSPPSNIKKKMNGINSLAAMILYFSVRSDNIHNRINTSARAILKAYILDS